MSASTTSAPAIRRLEFQERAARQVAARYRRHPAAGSELPFYQAFAVVTLLGKTLVLGDAVNALAEAMPVKPVVLWVSRGRVLAQNTYNTLQAGGRYERLLLGGAPVVPLGELEGEPALAVYFATVGTFAPGEQPTAGFSLAGSDLDGADAETLAALRRRPDPDGRRRPLVLVYDEAHKLSDEHADLLLTLEPSAILVATPATKLPRALVAVVDGLLEAGRRVDELITIPRAAADMA